MSELPNAAVKRILVKGGAGRISASALGMASVAAEDYLARLAKKAAEHAVEAKRKTVMEEDIQAARNALDGSVPPPPAM
jgi:histone H3/H4